jgi:hypothetical protein
MRYSGSWRIGTAIIFENNEIDLIILLEFRPSYTIGQTRVYLDTILSLIPGSWMTFRKIWNYRVGQIPLDNPEG